MHRKRIFPGQSSDPPAHLHLLIEQNKIKVVALKITNNINVLIKVSIPPQLRSGSYS